MEVHNLQKPLEWNLQGQRTPFRIAFARIILITECPVDSVSSQRNPLLDSRPSQTRRAGKRQGRTRFDDHHQTQRLARF